MFLFLGKMHLKSVNKKRWKEATNQKGLDGSNVPNTVLAWFVFEIFKGLHSIFVFQHY